ncbi:MAG TPA: hypothetical protein VHX68_18325, partial [Planctomycetaceae bacterium]|nr:hypothetical protein [Planctomycetaceae bacterium]
MNLASSLMLFWESWARSPFAARLASTLLHFLWQGAALGAGALLVHAALKRARPQIRYVALLTIFALMPLSTAVTWIVNRTDPQPTTARRVAAIERISSPDGAV